jgi:hypothetical protein
VRGAQARAHPRSDPTSFLREAAVGVAGLVPEDFDPGNLTIPLGVSTWLVRSDVELDEACDALLELRGAFLAVSGLDRRSEPVPLVGSDGRTAVLTLAVYLHGLMARGARAAGTTPADLAESALALLDS